MKRLVVFLVAIALFAGGCSPVTNGKDAKGDNSESISGEETQDRDVPDDYGNKPDDGSGVNNTSTIGSGAESGKTAPEAPGAGFMYITLYYRDMDGCVIPVTRKMAKVQSVATTAIKALIDSAPIREELKHYGLYPVLPAGTEVLGITIKDGTATIDFSPGVLQYDNETDERCIFSSVVYTLTQFATVDNVVIWINGYSGRELAFGSSIKGTMNRDNTMINCGYLNSTGTGGKTDIFYLKQADEGEPWLVPVSIETGEPNMDEIPGKAVELLAAGRSGTAVYTELPEGVRLLESSPDGDSLTLNFNSLILNYGGAGREEGLLRQLLHTMGEVRGVKRVRFLVEGEKKNLPEGTDVYNWMTVPDTINNYIDK